MWTCDCPEELRVSSNEKGASETVKFLAAKTNHVGKPHGWEVWNRPETLSVMTKMNWSNIHGEVKEAESMKSHSSGVGSRMEQDKEGKNSCCSLLHFNYIYLCIVKTKNCWIHVWLKIECVYLLKIIMNAGIVKSLPKNGHEWAHVPIGKAWKIWESPW